MFINSPYIHNTHYIKILDQQTKLIRPNCTYNRQQLLLNINAVVKYQWRFDICTLDDD